MHSNHRRTNASTDIKCPFHLHPTRTTRGNKIVHNLIRHRFVERPFISITPQIEFERLELDAEFIGDIFNLECRKVGLAGHGAKACEFRAIH